MKKCLLVFLFFSLFVFEVCALNEKNNKLNNKIVMIVKKTNVDASDIEAVEAVIDDMDNNSIECVNWGKQFPSKPEVSFKIAHNGTHIFLKYFVHENEILAQTDVDNGPVWTDSCVEFFISFAPNSYYNAEFSCIGKALLGYKVNGETKHGNNEIMQSLGRYASLGSEPFGKKQGDFEWSLLVVIPVSAYWESSLKSLDGVKASANFYKCGDNLTTPHFLSWKPIDTEKPNFHVPQFFGEIIFEK